MSRTTHFALFLLSAILITQYPPSTAAQFVTDSNGDPIQNGGSYYLVSSNWGKGGGLHLAKTGNETCGLSVVQSGDPLNWGIPVKISSMIRTLWVPQGRVDLKFTVLPRCAPKPSRWTVVEDLPAEETPVLKISGYGNTVDGSFEIHSVASHGNVFKFSFCRAGKVGCGIIGAVRDEGDFRIMGESTENEFEFVLMKLTGTTSSTA